MLWKRLRASEFANIDFELRPSLPLKVDVSRAIESFERIAGVASHIISASRLHMPQNSFAFHGLV
jgi:hypothetical protein